MSDRAAALAAGVVVLGALVGERLGPSPGGGCLLVASLALLAAVPGAPVGRRVAGFGVAGLVALGFVAAALMQRSLDGLEGPVARWAASEAPMVLTMDLVEDPRGTRWSVRALARLARGPGRGSLVAVTARGPAAGRLRVLSAGERAVLAGRLGPLAGPEQRFRWRHAAAGFQADDLLAAAPPASPVWRAANGLRDVVLSGTRLMPDEPAALTAGLLVGDDRHLPRRVSAAFRAAGLSHLLAVSGANVALVLAVAAPALRRFRLAGRFVGGAMVVGLFTAAARFEPSVLRAATMAAIGLLAAYLGRPVTGRRLLALAVAGLVLVDPFLIHSLGFRLSVAASAGILMLAAPLAARLPGPRPVRTALAVTGAAQMGVAPVALPAFGTLPLVALPANLLAAPAAAGLTLWGFGSGIAGGLIEPVAPGAAGALSVPTRFLATYLAGLATVAARCPVPVSSGALAGVGAVSALLVLAGRSRRWWWPRPCPPRPRGRCPEPGRPAP